MAGGDGERARASSSWCTSSLMHSIIGDGCRLSRRQRHETTLISCKMSNASILLCIVAVVCCLGASHATMMMTAPKSPLSSEDWKSIIEKNDDLRACGCDGHVCACCAHIDIKEVHIDDELCVNLTYVPATLAISLTVTLGDLVVYNKTVSLLDPDVCFSIPHIKVVELCLDFNNMNITKETVSGCLDVTAELLGKQVADFHLGCFHFDVPLADVAGVRHVLNEFGRVKTWRNAKPLPKKPLLMSTGPVKLEKQQ